MTETMTDGVVTVLLPVMDNSCTYSCTYSNLNGLYLDGRSDNDGVTWEYFNATAPRYYTLRYSDMKLRRSG